MPVSVYVAPLYDIVSNALATEHDTFFYIGGLHNRSLYRGVQTLKIICKLAIEIRT